MTTVVALARDGHVYMAADTMTNVYERPIPGGARKILRFSTGRGELLLGITGTGGLAGVCIASLEVPPEPMGDADPQPWAHSVAKAITELAVAAGLVEDGKLDATLILGWRDRLWTLTHAMAIPHPDGIAAVGSGEGPAIGALDALLDFAESMPPVEMVARACVFAINRDRYSGGPIHLEVLPTAASDAAPAG